MAAGTSIVQFLNYRSVTEQGVGRWKQRSFGSPTILLLDTKKIGKFCVHLIERWCVSRYGYSTLESSIVEARIDETTENAYASFLLNMGKPVVFPSLANSHICKDCRCLGQSPWLRYTLGQEDWSDLIIPFRDSYIRRFFEAKMGKPSGGF
jgi:hypothetical protein